MSQTGSSGEKLPVDPKSEEYIYLCLLRGNTILTKTRLYDKILTHRPAGPSLHTVT